MWAVLVLTATLAYGQSGSESGTLALPSDSAAFVADTVDSSLTAFRGEPPREELKVVRRKYKYRRHVALAIFMMAFVAIAMTTADALNPE
ncbi:MAG: hypothetical protein GF331_17110 [Chitinivibrionales bacterium]|nr:hypothetical protein [Chitinivibrionales bacterium]